MKISGICCENYLTSNLTLRIQLFYGAPRLYQLKQPVYTSAVYLNCLKMKQITAKIKRT